MPDIESTLDSIRAAKAATGTQSPPAARTEHIASVGAPAHLVPGARVKDLVSGQEGEVIAYGRADFIVPAARG